MIKGVVVTSDPDMPKDKGNKGGGRCICIGIRYMRMMEGALLLEPRERVLECWHDLEVVPSVDCQRAVKEDVRNIFSRIVAKGTICVQSYITIVKKRIGR